MSTEMIYPLIPLFLVNVLGATFIDVGLIEGVAESTASILKIVSGYLSDRFGKRKPLCTPAMRSQRSRSPCLHSQPCGSKSWQYGSLIALARALETQRVTLLFPSQRASGRGVIRLHTLSRYAWSRHRSAYRGGPVWHPKLSRAVPPRVHTGDTCHCSCGLFCERDSGQLAEQPAI